MNRFFLSLFSLALMTLSACAQNAAQRECVEGALFDQIVAHFFDPQTGRTTPYVAGTCEPKTIPAHPSQAEEALIINLEEVDCTTFVEYVTAARLAGLAEFDAQNVAFQKQVEQLRYRHGIRGNYATRKHYFMEWIKEGEELSLMTDVSGQLSGAKLLTKRIDFMSAHPQFYPQLKDAVLLSAIKEVENRLSREKVYYIPTSQIPAAQGGMQHGDIVTFVTDQAGLDVQHVGFVYDPSHTGRPSLLHASSSQKQVTISSGTIADYARSVKHVMGIRVIRLNP